VIYETGGIVIGPGAESRGVEVLAFACQACGFMRFHSTKVHGIDTKPA
jgi:hypothetical protein